MHESRRPNVPSEEGMLKDDRWYVQRSGCLDGISDVERLHVRGVKEIHIVALLVCCPRRTSNDGSHKRIQVFSWLVIVIEAEVFFDTRSHLLFGTDQPQILDQELGMSGVGLVK